MRALRALRIDDSYGKPEVLMDDNGYEFWLDALYIRNRDNRHICAVETACGYYKLGEFGRSACPYGQSEVECDRCKIKMQSASLDDDCPACRL